VKALCLNLSTAKKKKRKERNPESFQSQMEPWRATEEKRKGAFAERQELKPDKARSWKNQEEEVVL
jgi:hypothetical protein